MVNRRTMEREGLRRANREARKILRGRDTPNQSTVAKRITQEVEWEVWR